MAYTPKDDRPLSYPSPNSSNRSYFTEQAIRSGYSGRIDPRETEFERYPTELRDPVGRENERDCIRAEILEKEMARRRILEEEIRMELMMDREVAIQRWEASRMRVDAPSGTPMIVHDPLRNCRPLGHYEERMMPLHPMAPSRTVSRVDTPSGTPQYPLRMHYDTPSGTSQSVNEPLRIPQQLGQYEERRFQLPLMAPGRPVVGVGGSPYQHHRMPVPASGLGPRQIVKPHSEPRKEAIVSHQLQAKREANVSDLNKKRKASTLGPDRPGGSNLEKKPKGWTCELCKISTTCKTNLDAHLKGRRHKQMEEEAEKKQKSNVETTSEHVKQKISTTGITSNPTSNPEMKNVAKTIVKKPSEGKGPAKATVLEKKQKSKQNSSVQKPGPKTTPVQADPAKKFRLWCKICQVGANSEIVFAGHGKGKRHLANLEELEKAAPGNARTTSTNKPKQVMKQ